MSAVVLEDFCKPFAKTEISEKKSAIIMRATVLIVGIISVGLVYIVQHMGSVLQLSMTIPSICFGPMLGVYIIGLLLPWIGKRATFYGALTGCVGMIAFISKVQTEMARGNIVYPTMPVSTDGCQYDFIKLNNSTDIDRVPQETERDFFHLSFMYYTLLGSTMVVFSSVIFSFLFGFDVISNVNVNLLAPFLRKYFSKKIEKKKEYQKVYEKEVSKHEFIDINEHKLTDEIN